MCAAAAVAAALLCLQLVGFELSTYALRFNCCALRLYVLLLPVQDEKLLLIIYCRRLHEYCFNFIYIYYIYMYVCSM